MQITGYRSKLDMHKEFIKAELRIRGSSFSAIARELNLAPATITQVVIGKSRSQRVENCIAEKLGKPLHEVFPDRYESA